MADLKCNKIFYIPILYVRTKVVNAVNIKYGAIKGMWKTCIGIFVIQREWINKLYIVTETIKLNVRYQVDRYVK